MEDNVELKEFYISVGLTVWWIAFEFIFNSETLGNLKKFALANEINIFITCAFVFVTLAFMKKATANIFLMPSVSYAAMGVTFVILGFSLLQIGHAKSHNFWYDGWLARLYVSLIAVCCAYILFVVIFYYLKRVSKKLTSAEQVTATLSLLSIFISIIALLN